MNKQRLQEYRNLKHELRHLKGLIEREYMISSVNYTVGSKSSKIGSPTEDKAFRIIKLENTYHQLIKKMYDEIQEMEEFITQIPNPSTREIFRRRYIEGERWTKISIALNLGESTCRWRHDNYLKELATISNH